MQGPLGNVSNIHEIYPKVHVLYCHMHVECTLYRVASVFTYSHTTIKVKYSSATPKSLDTYKCVQYNQKLFLASNIFPYHH